ncbi:hypothetical protein ACOMHN_002313 [Nucella lapillus]
MPGRGKPKSFIFGITGKTTRSSKAGLHFPVGRIHRLLRRGNYTERVGHAAPVYMAAVLEYLACELLELSGNAARDNSKARILPRHIQLAIRNDDELDELLRSMTISQGGVIPYIHAVLLPPKKSTSPGSLKNKDGKTSPSKKSLSSKKSKVSKITPPKKKSFPKRKVVRTEGEDQESESEQSQSESVAVSSRESEQSQSESQEF